MCFSVVPIAAVVSITIHFLIQYDQIIVIDDSERETKPVHTKDVENAVKKINASDIPIPHGNIN